MTKSNVSILVATVTLMLGRDKKTGERNSLVKDEELTEALADKFGLTKKDIQSLVDDGKLKSVKVRAAAGRGDESVAVAAEKKRADDAEAAMAELQKTLDAEKKRGDDAEKDADELEKHVETLEKQIEDLTTQLEEATKPADDAGKAKA